MAIVTISHEMGASGPEIGVALADRLRYRYVDQDMISQAALKYGVDEAKLTPLDETKPSLFEWFEAETRQYITILQSALLDVAEADNVVIMGRGGQVLLRGIGHVLRVRVMAPFDLRVKRVMKEIAGKMGETVDARTTTRMVRESDGQKFGRMRYLYDVDWADPTLYDLVINTEKLAIEANVDLITGVLRRPELTTTEASQGAVRDRALASRVRAGLAAHADTRRYRFNVDANRGVVTVEGMADLDKAKEVASAVPGVVDVKVQLLEPPPIPPFVA